MSVDIIHSYFKTFLCCLNCMMESECDKLLQCVLRSVM